MITALIARNTYREATRDRVLAGVTAAGLALLAITQVASPLALGESTRLTVDLGLSAISLLGVLVVLLVGTSLVAKEIDRKTIYNLLSRPIARPAYLVGKWAGLTLALWTVIAVLAAALWLVLAVRGHGAYAPSLAEAAWMAALELAVVTAIAVLFSALSTPVLSSLYTLGLFVAGQWCYDLRDVAGRLPRELGTPLRLVCDVLPNLPVFNMRTLAAGGEPTSLAHLAIATTYAALYVGCALALAAAAFESRDFK